MKKKILYTLLTILLLSQSIVAQYGIPTPEPLGSGLDTLYFRSDSLNLSLDPDAQNNPFMQNSGGAMSGADDPGGPGSGGGFGDPPPDVIVPLDGGVGVLIVAGALLGFKRRKRKETAVKDAN